MSGNDLTGKEQPSRTSWAIALGGGLIAWIVIGSLWSDGGGEIAAIFTSTFVLMTAMFWDRRRREWFAPLVVGWVVVHAAALAIWILPLELHHSKAFIPIVSVDGLLLFGLFSLAERVWDGLGQQR